MSAASAPRILFVSANQGGGGSEELWVQTASHLTATGLPIRAATTWSSRAEGRLRQLEKGGVPHTKLTDGFADKVRRKLARGAPAGAAALQREIHAWKPALIVLNSGTSLDGLALLQIIAESGIPFVVVTHLVSTDNWPDDKTASLQRTLCARARRACFVSRHNQTLFETQTGATLENAQIVRNPYLVGRDMTVSWPYGQEELLRLAFPARVHPRTKGHDLLLDVLSAERWRSRKIAVSIFGKGPWQQTLEALIQARDLPNLKYHGHVSDVESIWSTHHALILPSRHEGLPICVVEAMMAGRPCIVNPAGGSAEFIEDGRTGFVSAACTAEALDDALERAWQARADWHQMGVAAARAIRGLVPADPAGEFARQLLEWLPK